MATESKRQPKQQTPLNPNSKTFTPTSPAAPKTAWGASNSLAAVKAAPPPAAPPVPPVPPSMARTGSGGFGGRSKSNGGHDHSHHHHHHQQGRGRGRGHRDNKQQQQQQQQQQRRRSGGHNDSRHGSGHGGGHHHSKHGGGGGGGGGGQHQQSKTYKHNTNLANVTLCQPGQGKTAAQKAVVRFSCEDLLQQRLLYLDPPTTISTTDDSTSSSVEWNPPEEVHWTDDSRKQFLQQVMDKGRKGGDVSRMPPRRASAPHDTAPPLEECAPLQVNEETRWKAKVFDSEPGKEEEGEEDTDEAVLKKALLILNKLSLTTFQKLSDEFIATGIGRNEACLHGSIELIVEKAQTEPHFSSMYAQLCTYLQQKQVGGGKKIFKKHLLHRCQEEFEVDVPHKIAKAIEGVTDPEELEYRANIVKKNYLGHMRFIGELYKIDLIKVDIMLWCLNELLDTNDGDDNHEDSLKCFAELMTTVGDSLEQQSEALMRAAGKPEPATKLEECWKAVDDLLAGKRGETISNRIRFMLLDLKELKHNNWNRRRKVEEAKTIAQIHKEVAKEERAKTSGVPRPQLGNRRASTGDVRTMDRKQPVVDKDGFTQVVRNTSMPGLHRSASDAGVYNRMKGSFRRTSSFTERPKEQTPPLKEEEAKEAPKPTTFPDPEECGEKFKNILKEYFVGGDTDDAVLSLHELVGVGNEGSVNRGAKAVEQGVMMVLEMKEENVKKMLTVLMRCLREDKLEKKAVLVGLNDPLEFLSDIEIDAPLAATHLATVIAEMVQSDILSLDFLLEGPVYFRTDGGRAAVLCAKVVKKLGGEVTDSQVELIEKLMTEDDKSSYDSARDLLEAA